MHNATDAGPEGLGSYNVAAQSVKLLAWTHLYGSLLVTWYKKYFSARNIFFRKKYFSPQEIYFSPQEIYFFRKK